MVFLITKNEYNYLDVSVFSDVKKVSGFTENDIIIYEDSDNTYNEILMFLTDCITASAKLVYIDSSSNFGRGLFFLFTGLGADVHPTSVFLDSQDALNHQLKTYGDAKPNLQLDIEALKKGFEILAETSSKTLVKKSVENTLDKLSKTITEVNATSSALFPALLEIKEYIKGIEDLNEINIKNVEDVKKQLKSFVDSKETSSTPIGYSTYPYSGMSNLLYIRNIANIKYLNSFVIVFQDYLKVTFNHNLKILLVIPNFKQIVERFTENTPFTVLRKEGLTLIDTSKADVFLTSDPRTAVMDKFFSLNADSFLIVDMVNDIDLVSGRVRKLWGCFPSDIGKFNLDPREVIFSTLNNKDSFHIPHITGYPALSTEERKSWYFNKCEEVYDKLALYMGLNLNK
jgi:hypothetical protein